MCGGAKWNASVTSRRVLELFEFTVTKPCLMLTIYGSASLLAVGEN
jgi:hypothetical protein